VFRALPGPATLVTALRAWQSQTSLPEEAGKPSEGGKSTRGRQACGSLSGLHGGEQPIQWEAMAREAHVDPGEPG